jgi:hypothetical protein
MSPRSNRAARTKAEKLRWNAERPANSFGGKFHQLGQLRVAGWCRPLLDLKASSQNWRATLVQLCALLKPTITQGLHLILIQNQIRAQHGGRPRLVFQEVQLLLGKGTAERDISQRGHERRLADERPRVTAAGIQANMQNVTRWDEKRFHDKIISSPEDPS